MCLPASSFIGLKQTNKENKLPLKFLESLSNSLLVYFSSYVGLEAK